MSSNPYETLHLEEDASYEEIKERYRHLTRYLHPDKQPLENYALTKTLFEQVDHAYKAIASPLRRFLFRQYGPTALKILEDMPGEFEEFDLPQLSAPQTQKLRQLMVYLLYEREAGMEMDRSKFSSKSLLNISKVMRARTQTQLQSKRNLSFPEVENSSFEYEMVLPEVSGFSNSLALSQTGLNLRTDPRYSLALALSSVRRLYTNYMLVLQCSLSSEDFNAEVSLDRICENNLHLKFTPLSLNNLDIGRPKFSIEKSHGQSQFSAVTDLASSSFEFSDFTRGKVGRSLRFYIEPGNVGIVPKVEWQVAPSLRFFLQLSSAVSFGEAEGSLNIQQAFSYGYKLMLADDLKLELTSSLGYPNYFQVAIINSKFRAAIPFATSEGSAAHFQLGKVAVMVLTYFCYQTYQWLQKRDRAFKERLRKEQSNRFAEQRRELQRQLGYVEMSAVAKREKEIRYNGLVIVRAYLGEKDLVREIRNKVRKAKLALEGGLGEKLARLEEVVLDLGLAQEDFTEELCEVTLLLQNEVSGGQLVGYDLQKLHPFNPSLSDATPPWLLLLSLERGQFRIHLLECRDRLWMGGVEGGRGVGELLGRGWGRVWSWAVGE